MSDGDLVFTAHQAEKVYEYRIDKLAHIFRDVKSDSLKGKRSGVYSIRDTDVPPDIIGVLLRSLGFTVHDIDENYIVMSW